MADTEPSEDGTEPAATSGWRWGLGLLAAIAFLLGAAIYAGHQNGGSRPADSSDLQIGGPFTLVAPDGRPFTQANLAGKPYAIYFGFIRCPDVCPTSLARLARLRHKLGADGSKFAIVFVSVDPGHDKPADVGRYAALFGTPIIGLTGSEAQLATIEKAWGVYVQKVPQPGGDYTIDHSAVTYLMTRDGRFSALIDHDEPDDAALAKLRAVIG